MRIHFAALLSAIALASVPKEPEPDTPSRCAKPSKIEQSPGSVSPGRLSLSSGHVVYPRRQVPEIRITHGNIPPSLYSSSCTRVSRSGHGKQPVSSHTHTYVKAIKTDDNLLSPTCYPPPYPFLTNAKCEEIKAMYATDRRHLIDGIEKLEAIKERTEVEECALLDDLATLLISQEEEKLAVKNALGPIGELNDLLQELKDSRDIAIKQVDDISLAMKFSKFIESEEYHAITSKIETFFLEYPVLRPKSTVAHCDSLIFTLQQKLLEQLEADRPNIHLPEKMLVNLHKSQSRLDGLLTLSMKGTFIPVSNRNLKEDLRLVSKQLALLKAKCELDHKIKEIQVYILELESRIAQATDLNEAKNYFHILGIYHEIYRKSLLLRFEFQVKKQQEQTGVKLSLGTKTGNEKK